MTVEQLIEELKQYPSDSVVYVYVGENLETQPAGGIEPLNFDEIDELLIHV